MKLPAPSDPEPCLIEIRAWGMHMRASGRVAVIVAGVLMAGYMAIRYL